MEKIIEVYKHDSGGDFSDEFLPIFVAFSKRGSNYTFREWCEKNDMEAVIKPYCVKFKSEKHYLQFILKNV